MYYRIFQFIVIPTRDQTPIPCIGGEVLATGLSGKSLRCPFVQFSLVSQLCLTLCNPMDCSIPGFPVLHHLLEFLKTHVHLVSDATQPSGPLSSPSPPAFSLSSIRVFSNELALHIRWPKFWSFSFSISLSNE